MHTGEVSALPTSTSVAIAIKRRDEQAHVGVLYRPAPAASPKLLHLAWHFDLRDEECRESYRSVAIADLPASMQPYLVARCTLVSNANTADGLPYGFGYEPARLKVESETGRITLDGFSGLTCATFVLAVLDDLKLLDIPSWRESEGDAEWKLKVIDSLRDRGADEEHVRAVERDTKFVRIQPEQVAAGAALRSRPASFDEVLPVAGEIREELEEAL